jgi:hypothetical protein
MVYTGSCHCGRIRFQVEGEVDSGMACNCSMCSRRGSLLWFVPRDKLRLLTDATAASTYLFNKHVIQHHFCANCGIHTHGEAQGPGGARMAAINLRTLEDFDLESVPVKHFDGRSQ